MAREVRATREEKEEDSRSQDFYSMVLLENLRQAIRWATNR